jgi:hypothetical protein
LENCANPDIKAIAPIAIVIGLLALKTEVSFQNTHPLALRKKHRFITGLFSPNTLHLTLTALTQEIEANAIHLWLDQLAEARSQFRILRIRQTALKNAVLNPLTVGF